MKKIVSLLLALVLTLALTACGGGESGQSAYSPDQVQAMADNVQEVLGKAGCECRQIEGYQNANWILLDYRDVIVHIFCREDRLFYDLERIWRDGKTFVGIDEL